MMKCFLLLSLLLYFVGVSSNQKTSPARRQVTSQCNNGNKNSLIEHFFNIIFSEFYATPPVCVCVQMCPGEFTYCYPKGCFKGAGNFRDERDPVDIQPSQLSTIAAPNKLYTMDDKYDFVTDFLEKNYGEYPKTVIPQVTPERDIRPDPCKDKYSLIGKIKRRPKVELSYNIREQVKNSKSEGVDLTKTRWPLKHFMKVKMESGSDATKVDKVNYFTKRFVDNNIAEYPSKYFKRELTKSSSHDDEESKVFNLFEYPINGTENTNFSLEFLIDTLIKNSFSKANTDGHRIATTDEPEYDINSAIEYSGDVSLNEAVNLNATNFLENIDLNKDPLNSSKLNTTNISQMISYLEKQIDKHNNTSTAVAKRIVENYEESNYNLTNPIEINGTIETKSNSIDNLWPTKLVTQKNTETETTTLKGLQVTRKNRQRFIRKLPNSKFN